MHCWKDCKLVQSLWKTAWSFLKRLKIEIPCHPAIPLLWIYPKETNTLTKKGIYILMFTAALFTIATPQKQCKCPSINEWVTKLWYICVCVYIYIYIWTMEYCSTIKMWTSYHLWQHGSEVRQRSQILYNLTYVESKIIIIIKIRAMVTRNK